MKEAPATDVDRHALEVVRKLGMELVPVTLPDWSFASMQIILLAEAAAFEEQTLDHTGWISGRCRFRMPGRTRFGRPGF